MIKEIIAKLAGLENLTAEEAASAMNEIMEGEATQAQIGAFLIALRMKGESIEEITGCARVMREKADRVAINRAEAIDIVGTGGDCANTFNISTCSAFIVAAAGVPVAKHGNRSVSSRCGSADVLEALGTNITLTPESAAECLQKSNICFMFAQSYHKSMKYVAGPRKEIGLRTIFNILGPLANPAKVQNQLLGVCDEQLLEPLTKALAGLGVRNIMTVNSQEGLDEISVSAPTNVYEYRRGQFSRYLLDPQDYGFKPGTLDDVRGGDALENAGIIKDILSGKLHGPKRDIVLLNAGAALYTAEKTGTIGEGIALAAAVIDHGAASLKLEEYGKISNRMKERSS
ncbi:anthranilate phosphoribosyltransferase [Syntrophobotulus glycolicus DSM 8271]|uniref:Anthranilate phosphoribosyltransferase n=1 Tax=Syntrophobotulus glycolicus (strain DSM 8271 / FlGlyR) TaxID=645991 RepID=F0SZ24_SYNGF|nr:anthranilate phosphoribosyltransferase [Syntrophobotulus glycolicus]ADY57142.1 anthranilate phosphoribosyltransferase [Syntrophobotulus glycolicus DSM 8271]